MRCAPACSRGGAEHTERGASRPPAGGSWPRRAVLVAAALLWLPAWQGAAAQATPASPAPQAVQSPAARDSAHTPASMPADGARVPGDTTAPERQVVEFYWGRIPSLTIDAFQPHGREDLALVPIRQILGLFGFRATVEAPGVVTGHRYPEDDTWRIDWPARVVRVGTKTVHLTPDQGLFDDGEIYLSTEVLGATFGWTLRADWSALVVAMDNGAELARLPVNIQRDRRRARALYLDASGTAYGQALRADTLKRQDRSPLRGLSLDYNTSIVGLQHPSLFWSGTVGTELLGGGLTYRAAGTAKVDPSGGGLQPGAFGGVLGWTLGLPRVSWLQQIRVGAGATTNSVAGAVMERGVALTNVPFVLPYTVGTEAYQGRQPAGWEVETYAGGRLVAIDTADAQGRWAVRVPVGYGQNNLNFRSYGPEGQEARFDQSRRVLGEMVPTGRLWWGVSGGQCRTGSFCQAVTNADARWGLGTRLTVGAGLDHWALAADATHGAAPLTVAYGQVTANPTGWLVVQGRVIPGRYTSATLRFEPSLRFVAFATRSATPYSLSLRDNPYSTPAVRAQWTGGLTTVPFARRSLFFGGLLQRVETNVTSANVLTLRSGFTAARAQVLPYAQTIWQTSRTGTMTRAVQGVTLVSALPRRLVPWTAVATVQAGVETDGGRLPDRGQLRVSQTLGGRYLLSTGLAWGSFRREPRPAFTVGLSTVLPFLRAATTTTGGAQGPAMTATTLGGSLLWDVGVTRPAFSALPATLASGVQGTVFEDTNGNGRQDRGEEGIPEVPVLLDQGRVTTDPQGRYALRNLNAFRAVTLGFDSTSFASSTSVPAFNRLGLVTPPNRNLRVDIPVAPGGSIEGTVRTGGASGGATGVLTQSVDVILRNTRTHESIRVQSFSDGTYLAAPLRPGTWTVRLDPEAIRVLGVSAEQTVDIPRSTTGITRRGVDLVIRPSVGARPAAPPAAPTTAPAPPLPEPAAIPPVRAPGSTSDGRPAASHPPQR